MIDVIGVYGLPDGVPTLQAHCSGQVDLWVDASAGTPDPVLIVDGMLGPLSAKRDRLRRWTQTYPDTLILTASITCLLAEQRRWVAQPEHLIGFDPWLLQTNARIMTVSEGEASSGRYRETLALLFPGWQWHPVADQVGGVFARVIAPLVNEAMAYRAMGLSAEEINRAVKLGLSHPRGPLEWAHRFGLSQVGLVLQAMQRHLGERFMPHPLIRQQMAQEGVDWDA